MSAVELRCTGPFAYREGVPDEPPDRERPPVLCLHGFPETSWMRHSLAALAATGAAASRPTAPAAGARARPARHVGPPGGGRRAVRRPPRSPPVVLVVHDWGGLIGLRWACDHPDRVEALVISASGFFPDGKWHGMAEGLRTPGTGEQMLAGIDRDGFGALMRSLGSGFDEETIDEYWLSLGTDAGRAAVLEMYRSGNFEELAPTRGSWRNWTCRRCCSGETDDFAPVATAHRLEHELPRSELRFVAGAGHFLADAPAGRRPPSASSWPRSAEAPGGAESPGAAPRTRPAEKPDSRFTKLRFGYRRCVRRSYGARPSSSGPVRSRSACRGRRPSQLLLRATRPREGKPPTATGQVATTDPFA
ncbi:MAG: alpha/beta hydrolase [Solirubrobacterales bacterium]